jgi:hypothetical protein
MNYTVKIKSLKEIDQQDKSSQSSDNAVILQPPNIEITVKNVDTLQQFAGKCHVDEDYLAKM